MLVGTRAVPRKSAKGADRDMFQVRAEPWWLTIIQKEADRIGVSLSGYVRMAVNERYERTHGTMPTKPEGRKS
jgi:hypothetical protein